MERFEQRLVGALSLDIPHEHRGRPDSPLLATSREAAVMVLFANSERGLSVLLTRRSEDVETHKGQMAFPGGSCDPEDERSLETTALRETEEEVGIPRALVRTLGRLPELVTTTGFRVTPVIALLALLVVMKRCSVKMLVVMALTLTI